MGTGKCRCDDCVESLDRRQEIKHGGVTEEELPRRPKKKTRKWCKGKIGVSHDPEWFMGEWYNVKICKNCGKHLKYNFKGW